jgi:hypothetical protein
MRFRHLERREQLEATTPGGLDQRLLRLEQAVDAIAVEVERMTESQRFTSRLLAERLPSPPALPGGTDQGSRP